MSKRDEILSVSLELFMQRGYERTSLADIAERIGFTKPAIYYYFDNKQSLYEECCSLFMDSIEKMWSSLAGEPETFKDALDRTLGSIDTLFLNFQALTHAEDSLSFFKYFLFMYEALAQVEWFRERISDFYSANMTHISGLMAVGQESGVIRKDLDSDVVSTTINALIDGLVLMHMADLEADIDSVGKRIAATMWAMVRA